MESENSKYLFAFGITVASGLATSLGSLVVFFAALANRTLLASGMAFSAGVMIYISLVDILSKSSDAFQQLFPDHSKPEAIGKMLGVCSLFGGIVFTYLLDMLVHKLYELVGKEGCSGHELPREATIVPPELGLEESFEGMRIKEEDVSIEKDNGTLLKSALVTGLAIALHNFPEGVATFIALSSNLGAGIPLAIAIACHNVPEGMAVALPVYYQSGSKWKAFLAGSASGITEPIGGAIAWIILSTTSQGDINQAVYGIMFGAVSGMMIYISFKELLPLSYKYNAKVVPVSVFGGMFLMALSLILFSFN